VAVGVLLAVGLLAAACSSGGSATGSTTSTRPAPSTTGSTAVGTGLPPIRHVFVIVLENEDYADTFGDPSSDPYLATVLPSSGAQLSEYHAIGHFSNDNYIALISGQAPNPDNQSDCQVFSDFPASATVAADGQISDSGCVFPSTVPTVADQLDAAHLTWKAYMQDMGNVPSRESAPPTSPRRRSPATATPPGTTRSSTSTRSSTTPPCVTPASSPSVPPPERCPRRPPPARRASPPT
jgi:hypothetical protein